MSINTTPFLHLPQWTAGEKPSFLAEINQAFSSIDGGVRANQVAVETAQTAAEAAKNQADDAVEQGHANASGLVTLQQGLTQLKADFTNAHYSKQVNLNMQNVHSMFQFNEAYIIYNNFVSHIFLKFEIVSNGTIANGDIIANISNIPFTHRTINLISTLSRTISLKWANGNTTDGVVFQINTQGQLIIKNGGEISNAPAGIDNEIVNTIPIFTGSNMRSIPDNCFFKTP